MVFLWFQEKYKIAHIPLQNLPKILIIYEKYD